MSKKQESVKDAVERIANKEIPGLMRCIVENKKIDVSEMATLIGLFDTAQHHLKLILARLE